jgi:NADH:ubiquinone oxidoreductase subunit 5 (subunit L)/multisubunit Na+/H+ antiporter MnhA subunit
MSLFGFTLIGALSSTVVSDEAIQVFYGFDLVSILCLVCAWGQLLFNYESDNKRAVSIAR